MEEGDFMRECTLNEELFMHVREEIFDLRDALGLDRVSIFFHETDL